MAHTTRLPFQHRNFPTGAGAALRAAREGSRRSRREVAVAASIAPRTLARIERGDQTPTWKTLERVCETLGISTVAVARRWSLDAMDVPDDPGQVPGLAIKRLRRRRGLTLARLSELVGVSASTLSRFERGVTVSRLLVERPGAPGVPYVDRDQVLSNRPLALALGFDDVAALRAACGGDADADDEGEGRSVTS